MPDSSSAPTNILYIIRRMSRSTKVIWGHWPQVTSHDVFSQGKYLSKWECWGLFWQWFSNFGRLYSIQKTSVSNDCIAPLRGFDLTSEVTGWPGTLKLGTIGFLTSRAIRSFFREALAPLRVERLGGPTDPPPHTHTHVGRCKTPHTGEG